MTYEITSLEQLKQVFERWFEDNKNDPRFFGEDAVDFGDAVGDELLYGVLYEKVDTRTLCELVVACGGEDWLREYVLDDVGSLFDSEFFAKCGKIYQEVTERQNEEWRRYAEKEKEQQKLKQATIKPSLDNFSAQELQEELRRRAGDV